MRRSTSPMHCVQAVAVRLAMMALSIACAITARAQAATTAELGVPFALHVGQSAALAGGVRITLTALTPQGKCPDAHTECVAVSPPQAEIDVVANGTKREHVLLLLPGSKSREQAVGRWSVSIVGVAPFAFSEEDVTRGRASATLLVKPVSTSGK